MPDDLERYARTRIGLTIQGKYVLRALLGCGGMAAVYEADHRNGMRVAIKMLHPHLALMSDMKARFTREGYVANRVGHPGAVVVMDDDRADDGSPFLVMELLRGETIEAWAQRSGGRLSPPEVCGIAAEVLGTLAAAHRHGVIHRDVKPANLFRTTGGSIKVLDFGIARLQDAVSAKTGKAHPMGTAGFISPEQALGKSSQVDGQTDVYAVAATMFYLLTGRTVHLGETVQEMWLKAASQRAAPVVEVAPDVPAAVAKVVDRGLSFAKSDRWQDAAAMAHALAEVRAHLYYGSLAPPPAPADPLAATLPGERRFEIETRRRSAIPPTVVTELAAPLPRALVPAGVAPTASAASVGQTASASVAPTVDATQIGPRRPRRAVAAIAAGIACLGGVAIATAAVLSRSASPDPPPVSASTWSIEIAPPLPTAADRLAPGAVPRVVFVARSGAGLRLADATVTEGGRVLARRLDGVPVDSSAGSHSFTFTARVNGVQQEQEVTATIRQQVAPNEVAVTFWRL
jgi:serine/threonine-protein kinase